ncbi:MAG TPA: nitrite reductase small subunit NirD [Rhodopila sp.]|jgi:nitrite reductase (NADH) small subunit|nr:nitrite reductase small subunit NirD [Rhodopila sp.]
MDGTDKETRFVDVGALDDIPRCGARTVTTPAGDIAVFRTGSNEVFALLDLCPHKQGVLSQGIVHGRNVTCPLHGWVISLETGKAHEPDVGCTRRFAAHVENGRVFLDAY